MPYCVRLERTVSGHRSEAPIETKGKWNQVYKDKRDAYGAMVDFVVDHLGYLPDEVIVDRKGTRRVKAFIDLGVLGDTSIRVVVVPAPPGRKALKRILNPLMRPIKGSTALIVIDQGRMAPLRFLVYDAQRREVLGNISVERTLSKQSEPGEIIGALAIRGYGPLLYDLAAYTLKAGGFAPGLISFPEERSEHADRLWSRQRDQRLWKPLSAAAFKRKYGVSAREILDLGHKVMRTSGLTAREWVGIRDDFDMEQEDKGWSI